MIHPSGAHTAAQALVDAIRRRVRVHEWPERIDGMCWVTYSPDPEETRTAIVATGQLAAPLATPAPLGPLVVGAARDLEVRIQLPRLIDGQDIRSVLGALEALDVIPRP